MQSAAEQPVVWCLLDSRPGHRNQVLGLTDAIQRRMPVTVHQIDIRGAMKGVLLGFASRRSLPQQRPHIIISAGHRTHIPLLQLGFRFGAKTVVLMKPSVPLRLFDLCIIPDVYQFSGTPRNLLLTKGVVNRIQPATTANARQGVVLVGGPSAHHEWSDEAVLRQLAEVIRASPDVHWQLATSRRTPNSFIESFQSLRPGLTAEIVTPDQVSPDWLPRQLNQCGRVWVTEDSVSMMYEAVTSGAATGILQLPCTRRNRAVQCIELLVDAGDVTLWNDWRQTKQLPKPSCRLAEADRCAAEMLNCGLLPVSTPQTAGSAA